MRYYNYRFIPSSDSSYPSFVEPNTIVRPSLTGGSWFEFMIVADLVSTTPVSTNQAMLNI
jgi:hypothetical protein